MKLVLDNLTKEFGEFVAVDHVNLTMTNGVYGLLGVNGAGKTTLMRMLCTLLKPTGGDIYCNGKDIFQLDGEYRNLLGYLPQDFGFYPEFSVKDYLFYIAAIKGIRPIVARKRAKELIARVGLTKVENKKLKKLSGGMKRRVGIAQAMLNNPQILILDEPTAGLDPEERVRFRGLLSRYAREGRTVLLSTHIVEDVHQLCEELAVLRKGRLFYAGTSAALLERVKGKIKLLHLENENQLVELQKKSVVLQTTYESRGLTARIIDEDSSFPGAVTDTATLEDAYVYCMGGKAHA